MKNGSALAAAALLLAALAAAQPSGPKVGSRLDSAPPSAAELADGRLQTLIDGQMAEEASIVTAERKAVAVIRADLHRDEAQQRAAVHGIREGYRARTAVMAARHAAEKALSGPL